MKKARQTTLLLLSAILLTSACKTTDQATNTPDQPATTQNTAQISEQETSAIPDDFLQRTVNNLTPEERNLFNEMNDQIIYESMESDESNFAFCSLESAFILGGSLYESPTDAELQTACAETRDACIADKKEAFEPNKSAQMPIPDDCAVTVGQFHACVQTIADNYTNITSQYIPCESQTTESIQAVGPEHPLSSLFNPLPTACEIVREKCPGAF